MSNVNSPVPFDEVIRREYEVLEFRRAGMTWHRIAERVGYATPSGAHAAYMRAMKRTLQEPADQVRQAEVDRLDRMQLALWPKAMRGEVNAVATILRVMERRAKLLGLDMPVKISQDVTVWEGGESIDRAVRDLAELLRANAADSSGESAVAGDTGEAEPATADAGLADMADPVGAGMGQDENGSRVDSVRGDISTQDEMGGSSENPR